MKIIGITGGVGAGKSTVLDLLKRTVPCICDPGRSGRTSGNGAWRNLLQSGNCIIWRTYPEKMTKPLTGRQFPM